MVSGVYTAPEVLMAGGEHSRASDMFSFGALLAQALTGDFSTRPDALLPRLGDAERALTKEVLGLRVTHIPIVPHTL